MVPAIFSKKFRIESVLAGSNTRTSTIGTVNNRAIETDLVLILISPYQINHLTGNIPYPAGIYNCGRQTVSEILKIKSLNLCQIKFFIAGEYPP